MIGIYSIENIVTGRRYIGQSIHLEVRESEHLSALRRNCHHNQHLQNAFNCYGESNFKFSILEECLDSELPEREIFWMNHYGGYTSDKLYNIVEGGNNVAGENNPNYGKHWSKEWRAAQSQRMKEYFSDPANHPMYGKHHSEETRKLISAAFTGCKQPEELNAKRSATLKRKYAQGLLVSPIKGKHHTEETKAILRMKASQYRHSEEAKAKIARKVSGDRNGMYGKHHSEEMRKHLSETHKGAGNHMYGKVRITDGVVNRTIPKGCPLPEGFRLGMKPRKNKITTLNEGE